MIDVQKTVPDSLHHTCVVATWPNMANGDEGSVIELANFADRSVQVTGDFGTGGNVRIEGSLDGSKDGSGNPLGGAVVYAVRASDQVMVGSVACDDRGVFECPTLDTTPHFVHSFYASGNLAGRSVATLTPGL